ncbi:hypothetical protein DFH06DRAFT_1472060 [Mycena polygramma]|nr:hypothetical protein DFH06DRAFT_1472060 [Mycena polygramma]
MSLPPSYDTLIISLDSHPEKDDLEFVIGRLLNEEIRQEADYSDDIGTSATASALAVRIGRDKSRITCFKCQKLGHFQNECPEPGPLVPFVPRNTTNTAPSRYSPQPTSGSPYPPSTPPKPPPPSPTSPNCNLQSALLAMQRTPAAWGFVVPLLAHEDANVQFFGAHREDLGGRKSISAQGSAGGIGGRTAPEGGKETAMQARHSCGLVVVSLTAAAAAGLKEGRLCEDVEEAPRIRWGDVARALGTSVPPSSRRPLPSVRFTFTAFPLHLRSFKLFSSVPPSVFIPSPLRLCVVQNALDLDYAAICTRPDDDRPSARAGYQIRALVEVRMGLLDAYWLSLSLDALPDLDYASAARAEGITPSGGAGGPSYFQRLRRSGAHPSAQPVGIVGVGEASTRTVDLTSLDEDDSNVEGCSGEGSADRYARGPLGYDCAAAEAGWGSSGRRLASSVSTGAALSGYLHRCCRGVVCGASPRRMAFWHLNGLLSTEQGQSTSSRGFDSPETYPYSARLGLLMPSYSLLVHSCEGVAWVRRKEPNLYIVIHQGGQAIQRTAVIKRDLAPKWDFLCNLSLDSPIALRLWHDSLLRCRDVCLGVAHTDLASLLDLSSSDSEFIRLRLISEDRQSSGTPAGMVLVRLMGQREAVTTAFANAQQDLAKLTLGSEATELIENPPLVTEPFEAGLSMIIAKLDMIVHLGDEIAQASILFLSFFLLLMMIQDSPVCKYGLENRVLAYFVTS